MGVGSIRTRATSGLIGVLALGLGGCGGGDRNRPGDEVTTIIPGGDTNGDTEASSTGESESNGSSDGGTSADGTSGDTGYKFDLGGGTGDGTGEAECDPAPADATLEGSVYAPNMQIPISGALVYVTNSKPSGVPDGVYCDECVSLPCDAHFALTQADGTFSLPASAGDAQWLVVQKGQFLRAVEIDITTGMQAVPVDLSNLPGSWDPDQGMWIPRIAVYETYPDEVFNVLAKFGMGEVDTNGELVFGTEQFTLIDDADQGAFMDDLTEMSKYHIIFVPCASTKYWTNAPNVPGSRIDNIQAYVAAGGKWYATDHSNEYIKEPFPGYQDFHSPAMPDIQPAYTVDGTVDDPEMLAWLDALPAPLKDIGNGNPTLNDLPQVELRLNYSGIDAVHDVVVQDDDGNDVNVGHHTWVSGPCTSCSDAMVERPMAITGQYGCGRMMYSTFENSSSAHPGLNPQELILLYMILEIGVCFEEPPPMPPPG